MNTYKPFASITDPKVVTACAYAAAEATRELWAVLPGVAPWSVAAHDRARMDAAYIARRLLSGETPTVEAMSIDRPFAEMTPEKQAMARVFFNIVWAMAEALGFERPTTKETHR